MKPLPNPYQNRVHKPRIAEADMHVEQQQKTNQIYTLYALLFFAYFHMKSISSEWWKVLLIDLNYLHIFVKNVFFFVSFYLTNKLLSNCIFQNNNVRVSCNVSGVNR